jgi:selenocysteine-specific elongation factor
VRGIQVHGAAIKQAIAGQRTAINLGGVEASALERGMVLAAPGRLRPTQIIDASIQVLEDAPRGIRSRQRVRLHIGAAEVLARVRVLDAGGLMGPGQEGFAQLRLETPIVGCIDDRFIVRAYSPQMTIGGGLILDPFAVKRRAKDFPDVRAALEKLEKGDRATRLAQFVSDAGLRGLRRQDIAARTAWHDEVIDAAAAAATARGSTLDVEGTLISRAAFDDFDRQLLAEISAHHKREPLSRGLPKEVLRERFFAGAADRFRAILAEIEKRGAVVTEKEVVRLRAHARELSAEDASKRDLLEQTFRVAGVVPPALNEAFARAGLKASEPHARKILQLLIDSGALVKVHGDMFFHASALDNLVTKLRAHAEQNIERAIDVGAFKDLAGISRKYAIPLLEYFDRQRVTRREGERRVIL